jgi:DNA-binding beta-propeller fold protein YncE
MNITRLLATFAMSAVPLTLASAPAQPNYHIVAKVPVGGAGGWDYLETDAVARRLYVTHGDHVVVIDMDALKVVGDVPDCPGMGGVALARELNRGFTANGTDDTVTVFALDTLKPLARWKATGKRPNQILYEPATKRLFTFNSTGRNATAFDAATGEVLGTIPLDGRTEFPAADGKGMIYDSLQDKATVVAIDARTLKVTATYSLAPHKDPAGTTMNPKTRRIFVACRSQSFLVLDADTGKILQTFPIGARNDAAKFDPGTKLAFASNGDGTLNIVREDSADKFTLLSTVQTEFGARTMAVDEKTHRVFLPNADFAPAAASTKDNPNPRRAMVPDTFRVLVLEP